jgi:hypothetical protein
MNEQPGVSRAGGDGTERPVPRLARSIEVERSWDADREAMLAAFRVVLGLPRALPHPAQGDLR